MTSDPAPSFGALLRSFRLAAGLTQEALAERAGLSARGVSSLEGGQRRAPYPHTVRQLARALRLSAADRARLAAALPRRAVAQPTPPAPTPAPPTNLPAPLTSFVGRERELVEVRRLLGEVRLLTLTGAGGVGKTRLALEVARTATGDAPDGVWLVELAALGDPALVAPALARALGVHEQPGRPVTEALVEALAPRRLLLALDNCEHLVDACAALAEALLRAAPGLTILATSREALGIAGETVWRVPSLALPDARQPPSPEGLAAVEAVALFVARAAAVRPGFALTAANAEAVARVCRRLDGIPLALELAAARTRALAAEELAARLDDCFRLLIGGSRTALPRQRTLRATLDWSHELLTEPERVLFRRLAAFAGGWMLAAAEAVSAGDGLDAGGVLDALTRLADRSLVQVEEDAAGATRYRLLETVRQYAREKLREAGEEAATRARHAAWCLALAEQAAPALRTDGQVVWLARLDAERDNLRAALAWCTEHDPEAGVRLAGSLARFWQYRSAFTEGRGWLERSLARTPTQTAPRAMALLGLGRLAREQGDFGAARAHFTAGLALARALGDARCTAWALRELGLLLTRAGDDAAGQALVEEGLTLVRTVGDPAGLGENLVFLSQVAAEQGDYRRARALGAEGLAVLRPVGDRWALAYALYELGEATLVTGDAAPAQALLEEGLALAEALGAPQMGASLRWQLGNVARWRGDLARAEAHYEASLAISRGLDNRRGIAWALVGLGRVAQQQGDGARAATLLEEGLAGYRAHGDRRGVSDALYALGLTAWGQGDAASAAVLLRDSLALQRELGERPDIAACLEALAAVAAAGAVGEAPPGRALRAARLLGAADALRQTMGASLPPSERLGHEEAARAARAALGETAFAAAWAAGRALAPEQAVAEALGEGAAPPTNLPAPLTSFVGRERELAEVRRLLGATRLLTLTGAGGVGKTRLALEVARAAQADYPDGVWLVELAALADPALVPQAVAAALGLPEAAQRPALALLIAALAPRRLLLLLDNCEHLVEGCAALAEALLRACPTLTILATSREPLGIAGEAPWRVPSLALPAADAQLTAGQAARAEAVRLFAERAAIVQPRFAVTDRNAPVVAEVCRRLDGIPLAIELAAARVRVLPVEEIARRLDDRFRLLTGGGRTAPPRQQTLRATLDWSYDLLAGPERALLRRLAVFVGGWTLEAAEAVGAGDGLAADEVLDRLTRLVDASLAQVDEGAAGAGRYRLLETVRQYALERLAEAGGGEAAAARDRHAAYYLALAERATAGGRVASVGWADRLRPEWGNVVAALRRAAGRGAVERALLASGGLVELWMITGQYAAPRALLAELLALPAAGAATPGRARALLCAGELAWMQDDTAAADAYLREAVALCRARGDGPGLGFALATAGWVAALAGDAATGRARLEEALPLVRAGGDARDLCAALHFLGYVAYVQGEVARARALQEEALALARQLGYPRGIGAALIRLGQTALAEGDHRLARARYAEAATTFRPAGYPSGWTMLLRGLANLAAAEGRPAEALRLAGAAERLAEAAGVPARRMDLGDAAGRLAACRAALGEAAAAAAWAAGRALAPEQAVAEALAVAEAPPSNPAAPSPTG